MQQYKTEGAGIPSALTVARRLSQRPSNTPIPKVLDGDVYRISNNDLVQPQMLDIYQGHLIYWGTRRRYLVASPHNSVDDRFAYHEGHAKGFPSLPRKTSSRYLANPSSSPASIHAPVGMPNSANHRTYCRYYTYVTDNNRLSDGAMMSTSGVASVPAPLTVSFYSEVVGPVLDPDLSTPRPFTYDLEPIRVYSTKTENNIRAIQNWINNRRPVLAPVDGRSAPSIASLPHKDPSPVASRRRDIGTYAYQNLHHRSAEDLVGRNNFAVEVPPWNVVYISAYEAFLVEDV